jgi:hypothetical protein
MSTPADSSQLWIVCEDGLEYLDRFQRFLGGEFRFAGAADGPALLEAVEVAGAGNAAGVILDLDFARTPADRLVDEQGACRPDLPEQERRRLAEVQGILILRLVRARGIGLPALLFADLDDAGQVEFLERTLGPLTVVPGHEGLVQTAERLRRGG